MFVTNNVTKIKENVDINKILFCKSPANLADIGTKFARINRSIKMINSEIVSPNSTYINGDTNLINNYKSLKDGIFIKGNQLKDEINLQTNVLLSNVIEENQDILEKDEKMKYNKLLRERKELYNSETDESSSKLVRSFEKIVNNRMNCEIRIMVIIFTAIEKFKKLINKIQQETEEQKSIVINPLVKYHNKELSYKCNRDELESYSENKAKHIQKIKKLSFLESRYHINEFQGITYEENTMVKNELQVHNLSQIQEEYYIGVSKRLINKLLILIISNAIIKKRQKLINQIEQDEILNIVNEICDLHLNHASTKNSIMEFVIQDMIKIIHNMLKNGIHVNINWPSSIK